MTSEDIYPHKSRRALKALQLQVEDNPTQLVSLDRNLPDGSARRQALTPDEKEYKAKGAIRRLESMLTASEDEI